MKRLGQSLFNLATFGSLLCLCAVLILWAGSYNGFYDAYLRTRGGNRYTARFQNGRVSCYRSHTATPPAQISWGASHIPVDDSDGDSADDVKTFLGLGYAAFPNPGKPPFEVWVLPKWLLIGPMHVLPGLWLVGLLRRIRASRRKASNRCAKCGYDLRATPERCPECGTAASDAKETAS